MGPGRLTCYTIGTTARQLLGGFSTWPILGRAPEPRPPPLDPPGAAILPGSGPEQRISELVDSEADGCWRTMQSDGTLFYPAAEACERTIGGYGASSRSNDR